MKNKDNFMKINLNNPIVSHYNPSIESIEKAMELRKNILIHKLLHQYKEKLKGKIVIISDKSNDIEIRNKDLNYYPILYKKIFIPKNF